MGTDGQGHGQEQILMDNHDGHWLAPRLECQPVRMPVEPGPNVSVVFTAPTGQGGPVPGSGAGTGTRSIESLIHCTSSKEALEPYKVTSGYR